MRTKSLGLKSAMYSIIALFIAVPSCPSRLYAQNPAEVAEIFSILRDGVGPSLTGAAFEQARTQLAEHAKDFVEIWTHNQTDSNPRCQRFAGAVKDLTASIQGNLETLSPTSEPIQKARFHLMVPALLSLHGMFKNGVDGGYSSIDANAHAKCAYQNEEQVRDRFENFVKELSRFHLRAVGNPGLLGVDKMVSELLALAETREVSRKRMSLTILGAATLASIILWEAAPVIAVKIAAVSGYTGLTTLGPWAAFGARSVAFAAESGVYQLAEAKLNPEPLERQTTKIASWEEQMRDIELLATTESSPEVEVAFLVQVQAQMVQMFRPWLEKTTKENPDQLSILDWKTTLGVARESFALSNASLVQVPGRLSDLIRETYGYQVNCESSWWSGLSDIQCVRGLRSFARALYDDRSRSLEKGEQSVLHFSLGTAKLPEVEYGETKVSAVLPYEGNPALLSDMIAATLLDPRFQHKVLAVQRLEAYKENVFLNLGIKLEFYSDLSIADRWRSLKQLEILMRKDPGVFDRETDIFRIGHWFQSIHESGLKLHEGISYKASWQQIREFLNKSRNFAEKSGFMAQLETDRKLVQDLQQSLHTSFGLTVECSPFAELTSRRCLESLNRLNQYLRVYPQYQLRIPQVMITAASESNRVEEIYGEPTVLALRTDFNYSSLGNFMKKN